MSSDDQFIQEAKEFALDFIGASTGRYDVFRPDYTSATSNEVQFGQKQRMSVRPTSMSSAEPKVAGMEHFSIISRNRAIQEGDVIIKNPASGSSVPLTVLNWDSVNKATVAFRTDRVFTLMNGKKTLISNIRGAYARTAGIGQDVTAHIEGSTPEDLKRVIIWQRSSIEKMQWLMDTVTQDKYRIDGIEYYQNVCVLIVEEAQ